MCLSDKYILRLTNSVIGNESPRLNENKNGVFIRLPAGLRNKGKCNIRVMDLNISLRNGTGNRVIANGTHIVCLRSNISMLGFNNENNGIPNILGSGIITDNNSNAVKLDSTSAMEFTCVNLPDEIFLERMCYKATTPFNLIPADDFVNDVVPFTIDLEITFFEDMDKK